MSKKQIGCVIMASGQSKRFESNQLMADFHGKSLIENVLEVTGGNLFAKRVVVTRSEEVRDLCRKQNVDVIFHDLPDRNDTVRLGVEAVKEMDGCIFCPCDQPLLQKKSLQRLIAQFEKREKGIERLCYGEKQGTPILFGKEFFEELMMLPMKSGGSYLVKKYPKLVEMVSAEDELELFDIDTREDYGRLLQKYI